ncbi:uncharacterized protein LOC119320339 isoform X1 [Triticum dicoccoides]|uniref:uncharacterized protein LOC119320339 isoform X1 n=1 Tax=Triticum dicoccoides TaxID=85692 RepID=UPI001891854C|nr:uncharacterized protein LOC119320339 isoform X1 [Triticum dicoccoides]XP_037450340.1 uncharacterized protein LOC119320339 isoform X1 [Triticum dicoccoides]
MHERRPPFLLLPPWLAAHPQEPPPLSRAPHSGIKLEHRYLGQGVVTLQAARSSAKLSRPCPASRRNTGDLAGSAWHNWIKYATASEGVQRCCWNQRIHPNEIRRDCSCWMCGECSYTNLEFQPSLLASAKGWKISNLLMQKHLLKPFSHKFDPVISVSHVTRFWLTCYSLRF